VQSLKINESAENVSQVRWYGEGAGPLSVYFSADGGGNWKHVLSGYWTALSEHPGNDLRWRVEFDYSDGSFPELTQMTIQWEEELAGVDEEAMPRIFALHQNTPNPFNPVTTVRYDVPPGGGHVNITVHDVAGRRVRTLVDAEEEPGARQVVWDGTSDTGERVASGIYYCRMRAPDFESAIRLILLK
jgi:hypothetical protein